MKRGVWFGGMVLSLGGWLARLDAEDQVWHAVGQPLTPVKLTGSELAPCPVSPAAALGRPVVIATSRPIPPALPGTPELRPVSYEPPAPPTIPSSPTNRVAAPILELEDPEEETPDQPELIEQVSLFASERSAVDTGSELRRIGVEPALIAVPEKSGTLPAPFTDSFVAAPTTITHVVDGPMPDPLHTAFWAKAEYLLWSVRPYNIPVLATAGNEVGQGILGQNGTVVLFGDSSLDGGLRSGLRLTAGAWLDMWHEDGVELSGFFLTEKTNHFAVNSAQAPVIARPFFDVNNGVQAVEQVAFPGITQSGNLTVNAPSRMFGFEADYRGKLCCGCDFRVDFIAGFRFLQLDEDLNVTENLQFLNGLTGGNAVFSGQTATAFDDFHTINHFYGSQVGIVAEKNWGDWSLEGRAKLALGFTTQKVDVNGSQQFVPNSALNATGDLLALRTNIGDRVQTRFTVVPEIDLNVGYQINEHVKAFVGYNFLFWSSVVRPGDQIDTGLDRNQIPNFNAGIEVLY